MKHYFTIIRLAVIFLLSVCSTLTYSQTGNLTGKVLSEKREGLIGATVKLKGSAIGGACDLDGNYSIKDIPVGEQKFVISYIGFTTREMTIAINAGENVQPDIILKEDKMLLNEVVVVGYGTQVKHDMSSSTATVKATDLMDKPVYNFTSALQGQASGVQVTTDNGIAGSTTTIRIRGTKTLSSTAEPLYVIDGVPIVAFDISRSHDAVGSNTSPLSSINPSDIESIEILKDAAATAIYGARGANGVVIVTTKSGKEGKTKIDFSYNAGITMPAHTIQMLNGPQFLSLYREAWHNDSIITPSIGKLTLPNGLTLAQAQNNNTNWIDQTFRTGYYNDANLSSSGGNAKTNFFVALGIRDDKSFLQANAFQRISFRANVMHNAGKYFDFGANVSLTRTENHYVNTSYAGGLGAAQSYMLPIYPLTNSDGSYFTPTAGQNPLAQSNLDQQQNVSWRTIDNLYANIHFLKYFTFHNEFGLDMIDQIETFYYPTAITGGSADAIDRRDNYFTYNYTTSLSFKKDFNPNNSFEALIGANPTATIEKFSYIEGKGFASTHFTEVQSADTITTATAGTGRQWAFSSFFGRLNYKYKNRHLLQFSFRADGSSRFAQANRYGYFPAGSYGWIMSEEKFFKKQKVMNFLKFRGSAGLVGNADFSNDFAYYNQYSTQWNYAGVVGAAPTITSVNNLRWESTLKTDVGIDFGFFDSRLSGLIDYYFEKTFNMLVQNSPLAPSSGYSSVTLNQGSVQNQGFELQLTSYNLSPKSKFQWKTVMNFALNRNKVTDLGGVSQVFGTGPNRNRAIVGYPVGVYWLAPYAGVDPATGNPLIYDFSGHKVLATSSSVETYAKPTGRPYPLFFGGLTNTFSYKGLELQILLTYSYGNQIYDDGGKYQSYTLAHGFNQTTDILDRWQKPGDIANIPKLSLSNYDNLNSSLFLHDASYLKLKNVTLAYNIPQKHLAKMKLRSLRFFISAQNIATLTPYKGWDPETNRDNSGSITQGVTYLAIPQARSFSAGFNLGL
jgi:TonB-linked SusC/RagA family outer membrane protein